MLAIQTAVAWDDLGTATASSAFVRQMASTATIGILGGLFSRWAGDALAALEAPGADEHACATAAGAIGDLFLVLVPVGMAAIAAALTLRDRRLR